MSSVPKACRSPQAILHYYVLGLSGLALALGSTPVLHGQSKPAQSRQPTLGTRVVPILRLNGLQFRDLDRDGKLSPFEDWRLSPAQRAADLVSRMTLEEKAGAMMHPVMDKDEQITEKHVTSFLLRSSGTASAMAERANIAQELAEKGRLAIPLTLSSDPRNGIAAGTQGTSVSAGSFSQWPDMPGFGAIGDPAVVRHFASIAAQEYRAVGITMALSPQADVPGDPRWPRIQGTFGEDPVKVGLLAGAYVEGIQGGSQGVTSTGVAAVVKHFAGYGAQVHGLDSHSYYGRFAILTQRQLDEQIAAFRPSLAARVSGVMPLYSILRVPGHPGVAGGFDKVLLTDTLRKREGYRGLILSDWGVTQDCDQPCRNGFDRIALPKVIMRGKPWGMEDATRAQRFAATINAGVDQIGDEEDSAVIVDAVTNGDVLQTRVDDSVRRIMALKFQLGLFENPYVDADRAAQTVGQPAFRAAALEAQQRSMVLLENKDGILPIQPAGKKVFLRGVTAAAANAAGFTVVDDIAKAVLAIISTHTPFQRLHPNFVMGNIFHEGDLDFKPDNPDLLAIQDAARHVPTIVTIDLDRPAILTAVRNAASGLIATFGVTDEALLNVLTGRARPQGTLPFELPSSMAAVEAQNSAIPHDSRKPLYPIGYGLKYGGDRGTSAISGSR